MSKILIDENLDTGIYQILNKHGFNAESVEFKGWDGFKNGELLKVAIDDGFDAIITMDTSWHEHSGFSSGKYGKFCVVVIKYNERGASKAAFRQWFADTIQNEKLRLDPGKIVNWPS